MVRQDEKEGLRSAVLQADDDGSYIPTRVPIVSCPQIPSDFFFPFRTTLVPQRLRRVFGFENTSSCEQFDLSRPACLARSIMASPASSSMLPSELSPVSIFCCSVMIKVSTLYSKGSMYGILIISGVMGGLLTLQPFVETFPEIDTQNPPNGQSSSYTSTVQGIAIGSYNLGTLLRIATCKQQI